MKAITYSRYGSKDVLSTSELPIPIPAPNEVQVKVHTTSVTTADWRIRASAFPGGLWLVGRMMFGLFRPKNPVRGMEFAGTVSAVGDGSTRFKVGDRVFGVTAGGAHAEYLTMPETDAIAPLPDALSFVDAAALPWGGLSALVFLRDIAGLKPGDRILIVGASGGVGVYATQIAKAMGAHVTAVAGKGRQAFLTALGADAVVDYTQADLSRLPDRYDVVFETVGAMTYAEARRILEPRGRFVPLNFGLKEAWTAATDFLRKSSISLAVGTDTREDLETLTRMVIARDVRPVIDTVFGLDQIKEAYSVVESRHRSGAVLLSVDNSQPEIAAA